MKRFGLIFLLCIMVLLAACSSKSSYSLRYSKECIESIEICAVMHDPDSADSGLAEYEVICSLTEDQTAHFLSQLENADCETYWSDPPFLISGYAVFVHYENGLTEILSTTGCGVFSGSEGDYTWSYFDEDVFHQLIGEYISLEGNVK